MSYKHHQDHKNLRQSLKPVLLALGIGLLLVLQFSEVGLAMGDRSNRGPYISKRGGGTRGCGDPMTAFVPTELVTLENGNAVEDTRGYTTQERPEFWVNVPYSPDEIQSLTFRVQNRKTKQNLYEVTVTPAATPGLIKLQIPDSEPGLQVGTRYQWSLKAKLKCVVPNNQIIEPITDVVAFVERYEPDAKLKQSLAGASPEEQVQIYSEENTWYDAFSLMQALKKDGSKNTTATYQIWKQLLGDYGLCLLVGLHPQQWKQRRLEDSPR